MLLLLKHKIFELCIDVIFNSAMNQCMRPSVIHEFKIGQTYSKLKFRILNSSGTTQIIEYRGCTIVDAFKFMPHLKQVIKFDANCEFKSCYLPDGSMTYDISYNCTNMLGTGWLLSHEK